MKTVRLSNNIVVETIPEYALPVSKWYGEVFASQCVEAPNTTQEGYVYNPETKKFSAPSIPTLSNAEKREKEYETLKCIDFQNDKLTVDEANKKYIEYLAEGNTPVCTELQTKITQAKEAIRKSYPDVVV